LCAHGLLRELGNMKDDCNGETNASG